MTISTRTIRAAAGFVVALAVGGAVSLPASSQETPTVDFDVDVFSDLDGNVGFSISGATVCVGAGRGMASGVFGRKTSAGFSNGVSFDDIPAGGSGDGELVIAAVKPCPDPPSPITFCVVGGEANLCFFSPEEDDYTHLTPSGSQRCGEDCTLLPMCGVGIQKINPAQILQSGPSPTLLVRIGAPTLEEQATSRDPAYLDSICGEPPSGEKSDVE